MSEEKVYFASGSIQLEGLLSMDGAFSNKRGMVLCHPHPQYGGSMDNPVITAAAEVASGEGFSTLRFNFRGVGESSGSYSEGIGEREDVRAGIDFLSSRLDKSSPLVLLGYSFGAWVGLRVAFEDKRIEGMVAIAPPLEMSEFEFLRGSKKKKLIIAGTRDLFCPAPKLEEWYHELNDPKFRATIPGADHFFFSHTHLLAEPLGKFLKQF